MDVVDDLVAEQDRLEGILEGLDAEGWARPSAAVGWAIADVVLHLAQSEEAVVATAAPGDGAGGRGLAIEGASVDEIMDSRVRAERAPGAVVFERWRTARRAAADALRAADPNTRLPWVGTPLTPSTLATTRLAEHWTHGLDIAEPLGAAFPDTDRLRHVAWLAHRSLPYAFSVTGEEPRAVFCELVAPDGKAWVYGDPDAESVITGPAGHFCRVAAQRLAAADSALVARGPYGATALRVLRTYAA